MVMSVNTNISSLNAQQNLAKSQSKLATAIERLSSGMRINSAKDDAAGLAISTRFTTQINGLNQAVSNANDGISLAQTTESALSEVTDNMQRIRQLAVQSANATNSDSDRAALDAEVQQRLAEITRISQQTTFNGRHVLDGSFGQAAFQIGANVGETISVNLSQGAGASQVGSVASASSNIGAALAVPGGLNLVAGDLTVNGTNVAAGNYTTASSLATAINTAAGSSIATVSGNELAFDNSSASAITFGGAKAASLGMSSVAAKGASTTTPGSASSSGLTADITSGRNAITLAAGDFTINGTNVTGTFQNITDLAAAVNAAGVAGVTAADDGTGKLQITNAGGAAATIAGGAATALGVNGSVAASGGTATSTITVASDVSSNANSIKLAAGQLKINGTDLTGVFSDAASLKTLIDGASISGLTTTVSSGELSFSNTSASAVTFSGSLALGLPASVAAQTTTPGADGTATSTGVNAAVTAAGTTSLTLGAGDFTLNGTDITGTFSTSQSVADAVNAKGISGVSAFVDDTGKLEIQSQSALTIAGTKAGAGTGDLGFTTGVTATSGSLASANVKTVASANDVINRIDSALSSISSMRSDLGAVQNRFDSTISNLQTISQNLSSSRSQIQDADFAAETANMSSANILQQAGVSVLAQANSSTQAVLKLLQ